MNLGDFIKQATAKLEQAGILTARLDTLVLLSDALQKDKAWLLAHTDQELPAKILADISPSIAARAKRTPLAYIRGYQEFYGRDFAVNQHVLIPRPESEALIDLLKPIAKDTTGILLDIGTGSGALGITAALECPDLEVRLIDINQEALAIAKKNADRLKLRLQFKKSDLLDECTKTQPYAQFIIANLPYVDQSWETSPETRFEPSLALFARDNGLALIKKLVGQVPAVLNSGGYLLLEADPRQHADIVESAKTQGLNLDNRQDFALVFVRV